MPNEEDITRLAAVIAKDARSAFAQLLTTTDHESPYGFAIYTDDSATSLDAAINTREAYSRKVAAPRSDTFAAYWYTIEWAFEGGVAAALESTSNVLEELTQNTDDESAYDKFRELVFSAMIRGMDSLVKSDYFAPHSSPGDSLFQIAVSDSEDDDRLMDLSIRTLNTAEVYDAFLQQRAEAGH